VLYNCGAGAYIFSHDKENRMRRTACAAAIVLILGGLAFGQAAAVGTVLPTVTYLEGDLSIDGVAAQVGDIVPAGALLVTGGSSIAEIEFNTRNVIKLAEKTSLVFNPGNLQTGSELRQGALTLVLKKIAPGANGQAFRVRTASAVAGVRGTSFFIKVESDTRTYVCACNGDVEVLDTDGGTLQDLAASHHKAVWISSPTGTAQLADAPLLYHTDADMQQTAADIGVTINWNVIDQ
jgi:hypothetical protein